MNIVIQSLLMILSQWNSESLVLTVLIRQLFSKQSKSESR